jgi:hypothetical protein
VTARACVPGRITHARQVEGQGPGERLVPGLPSLGLSLGLTASTYKAIYFKKSNNGCQKRKKWASAAKELEFLAECRTEVESN